MNNQQLRILNGSEFIHRRIGGPLMDKTTIKCWQMIEKKKKDNEKSLRQFSLQNQHKYLATGIFLQIREEKVFVW